MSGSDNDANDPFPVPVRPHLRPLRAQGPYDLETLASLADARPMLVIEYIRWGLLDPVAGRRAQDWQFDDNALLDLRKIQRLRDELGINLSGVGVVLELLRQCEALRAELARRGEG